MNYNQKNSNICDGGRHHINVFFFVIAVSVLTIASCSGADPVIYRLETTLQSYWNQEAHNPPYERLMVQILADDEDGFDEIYEVYLIHDGSELYWRMNKEEWDLVKDGKNDWILLNNIVMQDYALFPRGKYRIVLLDLSGYRDEMVFFIKQDERSLAIEYFPRLEKQDASTYIPLITSASKELPSTLMLELVYPQPKKDETDEILFEERNRVIMELGENGVFYEVQQGEVIRFSMDREQYSRFGAYIHHKTDDGAIFSTGPYEIMLNEKNLNRR